MTKTCISIYNEFSNIGPTRRTWLWRLKVKYSHTYTKICTVFLTSIRHLYITTVYYTCLISRDGKIHMLVQRVGAVRPDRPTALAL